MSEENIELEIQLRKKDEDLVAINSNLVKINREKTQLLNELDLANEINESLLIKLSQKAWKIIKLLR